MGSPRSIQIMVTYGDEVDETITVLNDEFNKMHDKFQRTQQMQLPMMTENMIKEADLEEDDEEENKIPIVHS